MARDRIRTVRDLLRAAKDGGELVCRSGYAPNGLGGDRYLVAYRWVGVGYETEVAHGAGRAAENLKLLPVRHERWTANGG